MTDWLPGSDVAVDVSVVLVAGQAAFLLAVVFLLADWIVNPRQRNGPE